jgi:hypothetical protein
MRRGPRGLTDFSGGKKIILFVKSVLVYLYGSYIARKDIANEIKNQVMRFSTKDCSDA